MTRNLALVHVGNPLDVFLAATRVLDDTPQTRQAGRPSPSSPLFDSRRRPPRPAHPHPASERRKDQEAD